MKSFNIFALSIVTAALAHAAPAIQCGTGDALAGVDIYIDQNTARIEMLSQDDEQPATVYTAALVGDQAQQLLAGQNVTLIGRTDDSFDFGGATTHAVLMNVKANVDAFSYDRNSNLAERGTVFSLFCNKSGLTPPANAK